jgi:hypothetical protein
MKSFLCLVLRFFICVLKTGWSVFEETVAIGCENYGTHKDAVSGERKILLTPILCVWVVNPLNAELNPMCHLLILLGDITFMGKRIVSISNKMQRYTVYLYLETALHAGAHTTVSTACGICHTVTAICRYRGRVGTGLSVLLVAYAPHPTPNQEDQGIPLRLDHQP